MLPNKLSLFPAVVLSLTVAIAAANQFEFGTTPQRVADNVDNSLQTLTQNAAIMTGDFEWLPMDGHLGGQFGSSGPASKRFYAWGKGGKRSANNVNEFIAVPIIPETSDDGEEGKGVHSSPGKRFYAWNNGKKRSSSGSLGLDKRFYAWNNGKRSSATVDDVNAMMDGGLGDIPEKRFYAWNNGKRSSSNNAVVFDNNESGVAAVTNNQPWNAMEKRFYSWNTGKKRSSETNAESAKRKFYAWAGR